MSLRLRRLLPVLAAATVVVSAAVALGHHGGPAARAADSALFAGIAQDGEALGSPDAPVTLEEYADLQCPFCREFSATVLPTVVRDYVRTGKVRIVFRNLAFIGPDSLRAARVAAAAAEQDRLWPFIDRFYAKQQTENTGYVTDDFLRSVAGGVRGLDVDRAMEAASGPGVDGPLQVAAARAQRYGMNSTPSFLVGRTGGGLKPIVGDVLDPATITAALDRA